MKVSRRRSGSEDHYLLLELRVLPR